MSPAGAVTTGGGTRVLLTRTPAKARPLAGILAERGFSCLISPLRQARRPTDREAEAALAVLAGGPWDGLVLTSARGVRGLQALADRAGRSAGDLVGPAAVHCVGSATARAAREAGLRPEPGPEEQSARGLLSALDERGPETGGLPPGAAVVCVHGEPHRPETAEGLRARGHRVAEAVVYTMVGWPARHPLEPAESGEPEGSSAAENPSEGRDPSRPEEIPPAPVLDRSATAEALDGGAVDVVVATSPELLRTLAALGPVPEPVVCIGSATAGAARALGLAAVVAAAPAPHDLADAVAEASATRRNA